MTSRISELPVSDLSLNYSMVFGFENNFDTEAKRQWMMKNWHHSIYYSGIYMMFIFCGQFYMQYRKRFELRHALVAWNTLLAVFSIFGLYRTLPEMYNALKIFGFTYSICNSSYLEQGRVSAFWSWMFIISKAPELIDTIFIVLRKQQLIFLHWYHHITVLLFSWYSYREQISIGRWYVVMNYVAHSLMYSYYSMKAMRLKVPRSLQIFITSIQILQMVLGFFISLIGFYMKRNGEVCQISDDLAKYALVLYSSYFVLFAHFFYNTYILPPRKGTKND